MACLQAEFRAADGAAIHYRAWLPAGTAKHAVLLFHRGHEHSGRWEETVQRLAMPDVAFFAWDQRGHGDSAGERGDAESVAVVAADADAFAKHIATTFNIRTEDTAVLAHSVGAVVAATWIHDYAPPIRGMVLAAPAFEVKLYVPLAIPALRMKERVLGKGVVKSYVKSTMLTHDPAEAAAYDADKAIFKQISVRMLLDLHETSRRLVADAGAITAPALILAAGKDWVVKTGAQRRFYERLSSPIKQFEILADFFHGMFHEKDRPLLITRIHAFLRQSFDRLPQRAALADADLGGYTRTEYDTLRTPDSLKWKLSRRSMTAMGALSNGIRLGKTSGFDSGVMLDYVYENRARGFPVLGTLIDRNYLDAIGWKGIRARRLNLERMLKETIAKVRADGKDVRILDIAAGAGRYVLETMASLKDTPISATLRDYQEVNLQTARAHVQRLGLTSVTVVQGDAFDQASLEAVTPKPTIAIVSGLYELFPENACLRRSLAGLAAAVETGGYLIYTCQPWHPQVELIARTLTNREGKPWIMRRRTQGEMDELVRQAGFEKVEQAIDRWGIFTVSLARRVAPVNGARA